MAGTIPTDILRTRMRKDTLADETAAVAALAEAAKLNAEARARISARAADIVKGLRSDARPGMMESFLAEYGLSTKEGVALMCLAEALLRVPDAETIDALIEDKISPSDWGAHIGHSASPLVNGSTWALMLTGKVLERTGDGMAGILRGAVRRLGEPVIRTAVGQAMKELGRQFVLGREIGEAMRRAETLEKKGYSYSYDMLGEAARTEGDARRYHLSYTQAIAAIAPACRSKDIRENPGISVKLSALHPRYEYPQRAACLPILVARTRSLAMLAKSAGMGFNIDAEEQDRLDLSLDVIEGVLSDPALSGWDGFGVVVQAYGPRALHVIEWLDELAERLDRKIMVRLVKGAYWDTEVKRAQVLGLDGFPVFTRKAHTDISYLACARRLFDATDRIYPQFATHNAHSAAAILEMAEGRPFEFQRLHGMGESLHDRIKAREGNRCRIYAPVGAHGDLLAYLVRRLLENGANSSFVNQILDEEIAPETIAADPFGAIEGGARPNAGIVPAVDLWGPDRRNSKGWDLTDPAEVEALDTARTRFRETRWEARPMVAGCVSGGTSCTVPNPAKPGETVGTVTEADSATVEAAISAARAGFEAWSATPVAERAAVLRRTADLYEAHAPEIFALATREAGKTLLDGIAEIREAVDFLRYYAGEAERRGDSAAPRGVFACISPWNFPLAIYTGQISAALAAGNAVIAKPAEQTPLIAARAVELMHEAGVPEAAIQLLPGDGATVGAALTSDPRIDGVCFTGSTETAKLIDRSMAEHMAPDAPLIAETGGMNAMIVDSTALPEQAVRDIVVSAFQSAGQRCSALRLLYVQQDVAEKVLEMLFGAMEALEIGDPWAISTDVGPVIDAEAKAGVEAHVARLENEGRLLKRLSAPADGTYVAPAVLQLTSMAEMEREVFGPVLHVATFANHEIDRVIGEINASGYGLTFGLHSRIDDRVQAVTSRVDCGNAYVNRNQIGAIVGSQPFGGEGMSGTGPKAGGPHYLDAFLRGREMPVVGPARQGPEADPAEIARRLAALKPAEGPLSTETLPGPTGESNRLSTHARGRVLCLGPDAGTGRALSEAALSRGNAVLAVFPGAVEAVKGLSGSVAALDAVLAPQALETLTGFDAVIAAPGHPDLGAIRRALAARKGAILPLILTEDAPRLVRERHLCIDTTAAGGNASLLAASGEG